VGGETVELLSPGGADYRPEAELARLGDPAVGVADVAQLPGQTKLAEAGQRLAVAVHQRMVALRRGYRHRHRQIGAGLVDPHPAGHIDEHVRAAERQPRVA
jgi:hypothetical protein